MYAFSRQFELDFPLAGLTALCVCVLINSEGFSESIDALLLGSSLGIASLVKLQILFFLCAPLFYSVWSIFSQENRGRCKALLNLALSFTLAYSIFSLYWGIKLKGLLVNFYQHAFSLYPFFKGSAPPVLGFEKVHILSLKNFTFYFISLLGHTSLPLFILFILALIKLINTKSIWRCFFLWSLLAPYFILTFLSVKWARYILPLVVFMAVLSAYLIDDLKLKYKYLKVTVIVGLIIYCLAIYFITSWQNRLPHQFFPFSTQFQSPHAPNPNNYILKVVKNEIIPYIQNGQKKYGQVKLGFINDNGYFSGIALLLYLFFQEDILNGKVNIQVFQEGQSFMSVKYIVVRKDYFLSKNKSFEYYKKVIELKGLDAVILEKDEKDSSA